MKILVLVTALVAAAAVAVPAEAASKKKKQVNNVQAPAGYSYRDRVPPSRQHPYGVYSADGELLGMDPDPTG